MKRYIFSLAAVVIVIGSFAFNNITPTQDMFVFEYDPAASGGYSKPAVENISNSNWKYKGKNLSLCENRNEKACRVAVTSAYVNSSSNPTALQGIEIGATLSGATAHVVSISGSGNAYSNQRD